MKRIILGAALLITSASGKVCAQNYWPEQDKKAKAQTATEKRFDASPYLCLRDFVYLRNEKVIFEVRDVNDYKSLMGIDTILQNLQKDISFYRDSLENGSGNVRIDYSITLSQEHKELRFIKYKQRGETFVIRKDETARLKIELDTIRIVVHNVEYKQEILPAKKDRKSSPILKPARWIYPVQVTLVLNSYKDIGKIAEQREVLLHAIDTLAMARNQRETDRPFSYPTSCIYRPYRFDSINKKSRFVKFPVTLEEEYGQFRMHSLSKPRLAFYVNTGVGVVRNSLVPFSDIGVSLADFHSYNRAHYFHTALSASPYFFFERGADRTSYLHDNWFVNLERGGVFDDENVLGVKAKEYTYGIGYLAVNKGDYFKDVTVKFFITATLTNGITISPEIIATNTFGQYFPGLTLKIKPINTAAY